MTTTSGMVRGQRGDAVPRAGPARSAFHLLHQRRLDGGFATSVDGACDRKREVAQCPEARGRRTDQLGELGVDGGGIGFAQVLLEHEVGRQPAVRSAPFERQLAADLRPAHPDGADDVGVGHEHLGEDHLVEVRGAVEEGNGIDGHAGAAQVDQQLAQPRMAVVGVTRADQRDHPVVFVRAGRPDLGAVDDPPIVTTHRACLHRREVAPRIGFAHPDAERELPRQMAGMNRSFCSGVPTLLRSGPL